MPRGKRFDGLNIPRAIERMGCCDVGGGSTMNTAGRYIGTDPVGEGGIYMRDTRRRTSGRTRGVLRVRCVGGVAYLRGVGGGEDGKTMWART
jgi:hypothetical protein